MADSIDCGLYLHIPFCRRRCRFCSFYLELHESDAAESFVSSLLTELRLYGDQQPFAGRPVTSLYFGGGTPTMLTSTQLIRLLTAARDRFDLLPEAEITIEAHPDSVTADDLAQLRAAGVTRLSFGAESMQPTELQQVGRPGTVDATVAAMTAARAVGFTNLNLDLMYGLPGQSLASWTDTLQQVIALNSTHLSCYALTIEDGTQLQQAIRLGTVAAPDEALQNDLEDLAAAVLTDAGYVRYEISNYARPGFACRHNRLHWTGGDYVGLGPSAQSYVAGRRFGNVSDLAAYHAALAEGRLPIVEDERLTADDDRCERLIFGLRLIEGTTLEDHDPTLPPTVRRRIEQLTTDRLLERAGGRIRLTAQGRRYADSVALQLLTGNAHPGDHSDRRRLSS